jgi:hypothetical protein
LAGRFGGGLAGGLSGSFGGPAGLLVDFQLAQAAIDGALDGGLVAVELAEQVFVAGIFGEGAGEAVVGVRRIGRRRELIGVGCVIGPVIRQTLNGAEVGVIDDFEAPDEDAGFPGDGAAEAPLIGGDELDEIFLGGTDGLEAGFEVLEEGIEFRGVFAGEDVFFSGEAVGNGVTAGGGLARL